jgi:starvation-inducible DNA-binding protein
MRRMTDREDAHRSQTKAATDMYQTKNDLPAQTRADVIGIRNARLADSIDLMPQAKQAHWHVKRPSFIALHKLGDDVVDAAEDSMDLLAERVVQVATARTMLKAYPLTLAEERAHVEALASALVAYSTSVRQGIEQADARGDRDTADICTEISQGIDTYLWFVEAHHG